MTSTALGSKPHHVVRQALHRHTPSTPGTHIPGKGTYNGAPTVRLDGEVFFLRSLYSKCSIAYYFLSSIIIFKVQFSSVGFGSTFLPRLRLMLVCIWRGLHWVLFYFFDHYIESSDLEHLCTCATLDARVYLAWALLGIILFVRSLFSKFRPRASMYLCYA